MKKYIYIAILVAVLVLVFVKVRDYIPRNMTDSGAVVQTTAGTTASSTPESNAIPAPLPADGRKFKYTEAYTNEIYGFSFLYPKGFSVVELPAAGGTSFVLKEDKNDTSGLQIVITDWNFSEKEITPAMIRESLPGLWVNDAKNIVLDREVRALSFHSNNPNFRTDSREVWFVRKGKLFQLSTYKSNDNLVGGLMGTWKFLP